VTTPRLSARAMAAISVGREHMKTLTTTELRDRLASGPLALFDVRGDIEFEKGHIPGAKTAPLGSLVFRVAGVMNPDSLVVVYSGSEDGLAAQAVERLEDLGLHNVYGDLDGIDGWFRAGLPVVPSVAAKTDAWGPVVDCRHLVVDRDRAYGGVFRSEPGSVDGEAGG
jgi:rhodanese-related sulfurtransferase